METKFGVQTLHGKYYLRIKPRCSGNLSTIRNLAYTVLRVLSRGQKYCFRMVVTEEP